jgi:transposase
MKPYSQDLRERVVQACDAGTQTQTQIATLFGVSTAWIRRLLQRRRETGSYAALPWNGGPRPKLDDRQRQRLVRLVQRQPDATLAQLQQRLGQPVSVSTLCRVLAVLRYTRKKKTLRASEQDRPDVAKDRTAWQNAQPHLDAQQLVFLDESGAHTSMTPLYGRAPVGERVYDHVPQGHWQMTTLLSAIRPTGVLAPFVFEGATDAEAFATYVEHVLVPELRPGELVVMDNLAPHKSARVEAAINRVGADVYFLPPYSPDFNPIEKLWSKVKTWLRRAKKRTKAALYQAVADALKAVTPADCQGFFTSCGYKINATPMCNPL